MTTHPDDELPDLKPPEERAAEVLEEEGGLPDDNPFADVVEQLREDGHSWQDILSTMNAVYDVVDSVAFGESMQQDHEWDVVVDPLPDDSAVDTERVTKLAESADKAREKVDLPERSEVVDVEYQGVASYS